MPGHMHKDHRKRVKTRFHKFGLRSFSPHEQLEMLLYYSIPQGDVNPLAHILMDRYGSLAAIADAPYEELLSIGGVGEHTATLLKMIPQIVRIYLEGASPVIEKYDTVDKIGELLVRNYLGTMREEVYLLLFDAKMGLLSCAPISAGTVTTVNLQPRMILEPAYAARAACVVLAHNHPNGIAVPSGDDLYLTNQLADALTRAGMPLLEHIIVAGTRFTPIMVRQNLTSGNPVLLDSAVHFYSGHGERYAAPCSAYPLKND